MLRKLVFSFLLTCVALVFTYQSNCFALDRAVPEKNRDAIVKKYLEGRDLAPVEGLWTWNYNGYNFEVAIIQNTTTVYKDYDFIGILTRSDRDSDIGEVKIALRSSSAKGVYPGLYIFQLMGLFGGSENYNINFVMTDYNLIVAVLPVSNYRSDRVLLIRNYPTGASNSKAAPKYSAGTGFFISGNIVATNYHVVADAKEIEVTFANDTKLPGTVIAKDPSNDLALLKVSGLEATAVPFPLGSVKDTKEGAPVWTVGFPLPDSMGTKAKISEGIINSLTGLGDDIRLFQISVPIQPGNSGGPLINNKGQVIGITRSSLNEKYFLLKRGVVPQNVNYAIKINYINNLLNTLPEEVNLPVGTADTTFDSEQIMERAKKAVVFIVVKH